MRKGKYDHLKRGLAVGAASGAALASVSVTLAPPAAAAATCDYDLLNRTVSVTIPDDATDDVARIQRADDDHLTVNGEQCGALATGHLTDRIEVAGTGDWDQVVLDSDLGPGLTPELAGTPEIEVEIDLAGDPHDRPPAQSVVFYGTDEADHITVGAEGANLNGDNDADVMAAGQFEWITHAEGGDDIVTGGGGAGTGGPTVGHRMVILGGAGDDDLIGGSTSYDSVLGEAGDDWIDGGDGGRDSVGYYDDAGPVTVDMANGTATRADGDDTFTNIESASGSTYGDTLLGSSESNVLRGLAGADTIDGAGGDDILWGDQGVDTMDGGSENDVVSYEETAPGSVEIDLRTQSAEFPGHEDENETFTSIEGARGGSYSDSITGDDGANVLYGSPGVDALVGLDGNDLLFGGTGNDSLSAGKGDDRVLPDEGRYGEVGSNDVAHGGLGVDLLDYTFVLDGVTVDLSAGATADGAGSDSIGGFENVSGTDAADTITGDAGANSLKGFAGDDILTGMAGDDHLDGGDDIDSCDPGEDAADSEVDCE
jgi:Ca2+-binding RTX toxin-like protein